MEEFNKYSRDRYDTKSKVTTYLASPQSRGDLYNEIEDICKELTNIRIREKEGIKASHSLHSLLINNFYDYESLVKVYPNMNNDKRLHKYYKFLLKTAKRLEKKMGVTYGDDERIKIAALVYYRIKEAIDYK